jgi:hypothetical protein
LWAAFFQGRAVPGPGGVRGGWVGYKGKMPKEHCFLGFLFWLIFKKGKGKSKHDL